MKGQCVLVVDEFAYLKKHFVKINAHYWKKTAELQMQNQSLADYVSMVLRSEGSLKLEMLSLARTSKYVDNTSVLSINKTEEDS